MFTANTILGVGTPVSTMFSYQQVEIINSSKYNITWLYIAYTEDVSKYHGLRGSHTVQVARTAQVAPLIAG